MNDALTPPYTIQTERLVLRCYNPSDAPLLQKAIGESLAELCMWMPWATSEPESLDAKVNRLREMRAAFDSGQDFTYAIFNRDESAILGGAGLHRRVGPGAFEIGYWIHSAHVGKGYASECAAAMARVAFEIHGVDRAEIHCDPENVASAAVARRIGFAHEATLRRRATSPDGTPRDTMIWTMFASDFGASTACLRRIDMFDALGRSREHEQPEFVDQRK